MIRIKTHHCFSLIVFLILLALFFPIPQHISLSYYNGCDGIEDVSNFLTGINFIEKYHTFVYFYRYSENRFGSSYSPKEFLENNFTGVCRDFARTSCCLAKEYGYKTRLAYNNSDFNVFWLLFDRDFGNLNSTHILCAANIDNKWVYLDQVGYWYASRLNEKDYPDFEYYDLS